MVSLSDLRLRAVQARIAQVASVAAAPAELGEVRLRDDQRRMVARVARALARDGGCLLADDVGRGKTYVALAIARAWTHPLVVIPASLRHTWLEAMRRADVHCALVTHESLSRGRAPVLAADGIIVDESHRFRSPASRRHELLARIASHAPLLLLSATPLQNGARDLAAQLALFLGSSAFQRSPAELARHVVRGSDLRDAQLPAVAPPLWVHPESDDGAVLRAILSLPAPPQPIDCGDAGVLRTIGLVRAWASSRAALVATLRRRRQVTTAIEQCAAEGLAPSRRDVRAWQGIGADVQLALAPLLVSHALTDDASVITSALVAERTALEALERTIAASADPDAARVAALRTLRTEHPGLRILAFSEFASTVRAYFAAMRNDAEVGLLTAADARIASGRLPRDALLARFAPTAQGATAPGPRERVSLLLSTDLLSEGVNLQDASVVVHLDLPWNPARLAQRVGRVRRPGGAPVVHSYLLAPPARTELLLQVESRLRTKLARAERTIGRVIHVMPALASVSPEWTPVADPRHDSNDASASTIGELADRVSRWRRASRRDGSCDAPMLAATTGAHLGWLAALDDGRLIASFEGGPTDNVTSVARAACLAEGWGRACAPGEAELPLAAVKRWLEREELALACGVIGAHSTLDLALERRLARAVGRAPRHERSGTLALAARLRDALRGGRSLGAERELAALLEECPDLASADRRWLERTLSIAIQSPRHGAGGSVPRVVAMIVLGDAFALL